MINFLNFYQQTKHQLTLLNPSWDTANLSVLRPDWPHPFLTIPMPIFFDQLLFSMNLHQYAKNQASSSFCSRDIVNLKILQSDWSRAFSAISQELEFSQVWDLHKNIANIKFLYGPNSEKIITQFSNKFKKPYFWPIFHIFGAKKIFLENPTLSRTTLYEFLAPC